MTRLSLTVEPMSLPETITRHYLRATDEGGPDLLDGLEHPEVFEIGYRLGFLNALQFVGSGDPAAWVPVAIEAVRLEDDAPQPVEP